jgi:hypothetical protein
LRLPTTGRLTAAIGCAPLYVAIFCVLFPLATFNVLSDYYGWHGLVPASALLLAIALLIFWVVRRLVPDAHLGGLAALSCLVALFPTSIATLPVFAILAGIGTVIVVVRLWRRGRQAFADPVWLPASFTRIANVVAIAVLVAVEAPAAVGHFETRQEARRFTAERLAALGPIPTGPPRTLPHIVHIVLDGYSRADVLQNTYDFDNGPFLSALRQRGFHIADQATTPFNQTLFVMSSIFSLGAVTDPDSFRTPSGGNASYRNMLIEIMRSGAVPTVLAALGYEIRTTPEALDAVQLGTPVKPDGQASLLGSFGFLTTYVLAYDMLKWSPALGGVSKKLLGPYLDVVAVNYRYLRAIPERKFDRPDDRAIFVYEHILAPHPPFNITPEGDPRELGGFPLVLADNSTLIRGSAQKRDEYRHGYIAKLRYVNDAILRQIDELLASSSRPTIIILHGDHGGGLHHEQDHKSRTCLTERFSPLLAVFATDRAVLSEIGEDFNIVNLYRAIFRAILGADLPDLPDSSTFVSWKLNEIAPVRAEERNDNCPAPPLQDRVALP